MPVVLAQITLLQISLIHIFQTTEGLWFLYIYIRKYARSNQKWTIQRTTEQTQSSIICVGHHYIQTNT